MALVWALGRPRLLEGATAAAALALSWGLPAAVQAGEPITVTVAAQGFDQPKGTALITLYDSSETWLDVDQAPFVVRAPVYGDTVQATIVGVPAGIWSVSVIHDANDNGTLDMRWFPVPRPAESAAHHPSHALSPLPTATDSTSMGTSPMAVPTM